MMLEAKALTILRLRRIVRGFAARQCDEYQNLMLAQIIQETTLDFLTQTQAINDGLHILSGFGEYKKDSRKE